MNTTTNVYFDELDEKRTCEMALRWRPPCQLVPDPKFPDRQIAHAGYRCINVLEQRGDVSHRQLEAAVEYLEEAIAYYASGAPLAGVPETDPVHKLLTESKESAHADLNEMLALVQQAVKLADPRVDRRVDA